MRKYWSVAAVLAGVLLAAPAAVSAHDIAFQSDRQGDSDIWIMSANGAGARALTQNRWEDATPDWSPDGQKIVYASAPDGVQFDLYELTLESGAVRPRNSPNARDSEACYLNTQLQIWITRRA